MSGAQEMWEHLEPDLMILSSSVVGSAMTQLLRLRSRQAHPPSVQALPVILGEMPYFYRSLQPGRLSFRVLRGMKCSPVSMFAPESSRD